MRIVRFENDQRESAIPVQRRMICLMLSLGVLAAVSADPNAQGRPTAPKPATAPGRPAVSHKPLPENMDLAKRQGAAYRTGGLKAAAALTGSAIRNLHVGFSGRPYGREDLLTQTVLVVVGRPVSNVSRLTADGMDIMLEYRVQPTSVLKGTRSLRDITVVIPGGRVSFPDGSWAQVNTPGFMWPLPKHEYLWCLKPASGETYAKLQRDSSTGIVYEPAYGPLGIYSLTTDFVRPSGGRGSPLASEVLRARMDREAFLQWISAAIK